MTRILFFTTNFYPYLGGLENYVLELARRLIKKGIKVDVLTYNVNRIEEYEEYNGIGIYRIPCYDILKDVYSLPKFNADTKMILKKLAENKYDFVITQTRFFSSSWLGMRFAKKNNIRHIHTEHGNVHVKHDNKIIELVAWLYDMTIGKKIFRSAWKVVGISKACCDFAIRMGADLNKVLLVHNSVDTSEFMPKDRGTKERVRKELNINEGSFVITYVGRLIYAKGVHDLIKALKGMPEAVLIIIGKGPYRGELKRLADYTVVNCQFIGEKSSKEIVDLLNASDLFVNPSLSEGLPTSVLEAGACGVPIIATDVGGTREIIDDGKDGFLVKSQDSESLREKILILKDDKSVKEKFAKSIRKKIEQEFDWDKNVERYVGEVLENKGRS